MPAIYTHLRFGEEVAKTLPEPYVSVIHKYIEAFRLGTQGPDILFYHQPLKANEIRKYGTYLHTFSGNRFFALQAKLFNEQTGRNLEDSLKNNGAFSAYLCGFLCHFTLDAICHPYIDEHSTEAVSHGKIESELDKYLLRKDGLPIRGYNTATPILDENGTAEACAKALGVSKEEITLSIKTIRKINGWFSSKCEPFHGIAHLFLKMVGMERKFGDMFLHKKDDPLCAEPNEELYTRWQNSVPVAGKIIEEFFNNIDTLANDGVLKNELFRYDFSGIIKEET
ncbi:MAG: zinc dependent phospholipase C family protein [Clostridia bacterium]|nr:zinc dependent phospholipase C family protein [Clostridia bacterium]